ncbi:MAG: hypothetical protein RR835_02355 [Peptostreptococcaceae bacterium]
MRNRIRELYITGYSVSEIAAELKRKEGSVKMFINRNLKDFKKVHDEQKRIREGLKKIDDFEFIKEKYIEGYNAKEIALILEKSHGYIRNYISKNLKEYGFKHRKARDLNNEIRKAVKSLNNSIMSNSAILKQNRQSYRYDKKYNIEFDEQSRSAKPDDMPKKFYRKSSIV